MAPITAPRASRSAARVFVRIKTVALVDGDYRERRAALLDAAGAVRLFSTRADALAAWEASHADAGARVLRLDTFGAERTYAVRPAGADADLFFVIGTARVVS